MKEKIRIGIIGTGFARKTQIPALISLENAEIVSVASGSLENAKNTAEEFGIEHFTDNWRETIKRKDIDLISITTPPKLHHEMTLFAIENNKHILCEKPMAMNVAEAEEMTKLANEKGLLALIDHELRFTKGRLKAFDLLRKDKIGKVLHAKYIFCNSSRGDVLRPWSWWSDAEQGGGALGAIGSHVIDSFRWFLDTEITEVFCQLHTHVKHRPVENSEEKREVTTDDETLMILNFADGELLQDATANVSASMVEAGNYRNAIEFYGTKGALKIEDDGKIFFTDIRENKWREIETDLGNIAPKMQYSGWSLGFVDFAEVIIDNLQKGNTKIENAATFEDGLRVQKVLDAAHESNEKGCKIKIN